MSNRDSRLQAVLDQARSNPALMTSAEGIGQAFMHVYGDLYSPEQGSQALAEFSITAPNPNPDILEVYAVITAGAFGTKDLATAKRFSQFARGRTL